MKAILSLLNFVCWLWLVRARTSSNANCNHISVGPNWVIVAVNGGDATLLFVIFIHCFQFFFFHLTIECRQMGNFVLTMMMVYKRRISRKRFSTTENKSECFETRAPIKAGRGTLLVHIDSNRWNWIVCCHLMKNVSRFWTANRTK